MPNDNNRETVNIRPSVGYLSILQAINYRAWYAIAEFVDNSLQSYLHNKPMLRKLHGTNFKLKIAYINTETNNLYGKDVVVNLNQNENRKHEFCLLQIKPMVVGGLDKVKIGEPSKAVDVICTSSVALGNGALKDIKNIIFIDPKIFDASKSMQIAKEIEQIYIFFRAPLLTHDKSLRDTCTLPSRF